MTMAAAAVDDEDDDGDGDNEDDEAAALEVFTRTLVGADGLSAESEVVGVLARPSTIDDAEFSSIRHVT